MISKFHYKLDPLRRYDGLNFMGLRLENQFFDQKQNSKYSDFDFAAWYHQQNCGLPARCSAPRTSRQPEATTAQSGRLTRIAEILEEKWNHAEMED